MSRLTGYSNDIAAGATINMEHLNYCRSMRKQFMVAIERPGFPSEHRKVLSRLIYLAKESQKFILPDGGRLYDDPEYRALDENETLNLPYPLIALEYARNKSSAKENEENSKKCVLFARELAEVIVLSPVMWIDKLNMWGPLPEVAIPRVGYLDRALVTDGRTAIKLQQSDVRVPISDYGDEVGALLCMLNVLQCRNVSVTKSEVSKTRKAMTTGKKGALPFDSYHVLTIDVPGKTGDGAPTGGHRSPREHLRRGHIRRLDGGRRVWVNATVVSAGLGAGKVHKDYVIGKEMVVH